MVDGKVVMLGKRELIFTRRSGCAFARAAVRSYTEFDRGEYNYVKHHDS